LGGLRFFSTSASVIIICPLRARVCLPRMTQPRGDGHLTALLTEWAAGNEAASEELLPIVYSELRRIARRHMSRESPGHILQTTALVNEAYLRLVDSTNIEWRDRAHFFAVASRTMRRLLVDIARARHFQKRGGHAFHVTFTDDLAVAVDRTERVLAVHDALAALEGAHPRKAKVVEMRFFGGMSLEEIAMVLDMSPETAKRDWKFAKTWLRRQFDV
jgi:RNA polymerase sigma-70 factor, ECF subfamily